ncbi:MAG: type III-A CRISPR-associated RAMP protein Csm4 [Euryarchaeota archaeon]|nr:type III-A CRISPR-associated RAMP protein Csm4 [Euryarchaeota archaeon]
MDTVYLDLLSPFPIDLQSNRIFGAICVGMNELYGDDELSSMLEQFRGGSAPFILSSAFPFVYGEDNKTKYHFFPKPIVKPSALDDHEEHYDAAKNYKKVKYLDQSLFNRFINGETNEILLIRDLSSNNVKIARKMFLTGTDINNDFVIRKQDTPHNILNRLSGSSENFYYTTGLNFENSGLFFLIKFYDKAYRSKVMASLRFIEDRGFGGNISSGMGQFKLSVVTDSELIKKPERDAGYSMTLSLYSPEDFNSFDKSRCWYELIKTRGRCGDGFMKKSIWVFKEGSTFPIHDQKICGKVVYVRENPDVVEYGIAFPVGMVEP